MITLHFCKEIGIAMHDIFQFLIVGVLGQVDFPKSFILCPLNIREFTQRRKYDIYLGSLQKRHPPEPDIIGIRADLEEDILFKNISVQQIFFIKYSSSACAEIAEGRFSLFYFVSPRRVRSKASRSDSEFMAAQTVQHIGPADVGIYQSPQIVRRIDDVIISGNNDIVRILFERRDSAT